MIKIAFVLRTFPSVTETFILSQIVGLTKLGHSIDIWAFQREETAVLHKEILEYHLLKKVRYFKQFSSSRWLRRLILLKDLFFCFLKSPFRTLKAIFWMKRHQPGFSYSLFYQIFPFIVNHYEIVHCHFGPLGEIGAAVKQSGLCERLVTTFYGYDISEYIKRHSRDVYRELFDAADRLLVLSRFMRDIILGLGAPPEKVEIHHLCADGTAFPFRERKRAEGRPVRLLTVARLTEKKGLSYSIQAVALALKKNPSFQIRYHIIGEGELRHSLEQLVKSLHVESFVEFCGAKPQSEVRRYMDEADIFILSSVTSASGDQEGTPTALIEAISSGLPVLSTCHAGIPDIIIHGESGFLVPEKDVEVLAEKLIYLLEHPEQWAEMGRKGREHFEKYFDCHIVNKKLETIYYNLLHRC